MDGLGEENEQFRLRKLTIQTSRPRKRKMEIEKTDDQTEKLIIQTEKLEDLDQKTDDLG